MNLRFAGMLVAVLVAYTPAVLTSALPASLAGFGKIGLLGAPVAALLGWWLTPMAAKASWWWAAGVGLGMGVLAAPLGAWTLAYVGLLGRLSGIGGVSSMNPGVEALLVATIGLPVSAIALPLTVPCGLAWALLMRGPLRRFVGTGEVGQTSLGVSHVVVVLAVIAVGAALVPRT